MRMRAVLASLVLIATVAVGATTAVADPNLSDVSPHRHWLTLPSGGQVQVGPIVCGNPNMQDAFNQFHNNLHISSGLGPAAPGLHNITGAEITATGC
jgi:hypothetical protein